MSELENTPLSKPEGRPGRGRAYLIQGLLALLVLAIAMAAGWSLLQSSPAAGSRPAPEPEARLVETVVLEPTDYQPVITGWGTLAPSRELSLSAQVSGSVTALSPRLEPGLTVSTGDTLVTLETAPYEAAVVQAEGALAEARANLALEKGQQAVAEREFQLLNESMLGLGSAEEKSRNALAENSAPLAQAPDQGLALREPQLRIAQAAVASAQARLDDARLDLERTTVQAPFEALVQSRGVTLGTQVSANTEIAQLVGIQTWWVNVLVPSNKLPWLPTAGEAPATVNLHQPGVWGEEQSRQGNLLRVLPELESSGRLAQVLVAISDPLGQPLGTPGNGHPAPPLLLGSFLRADIPGQRLHNVFVLEPRWLRDANQVWLMDAEGALRYRTVDVLYRDQEAVVVSAGLEAGERLVTSRLTTPAEGMPLRTEVRPESASQAPALGSGQDTTTETVKGAAEADHG